MDPEVLIEGPMATIHNKEYFDRTHILARLGANQEDLPELSLIASISDLFALDFPVVACFEKGRSVSQGRTFA